MLSIKKYSFRFIFFTFITIQNIINAAELTGTVYDTTSTPIKDVKVKLECLSGDPFLDSLYTDSVGGYLFTGFPMGSFRISLRKTGYIPKDSLLVLGSSDYVINFVLLDSISGTYHSGEENGVWLPSGNPHFIVGDVTVTDSLYIAPGCTVRFEPSSKIILNGNFKIGSPDSTAVYFERFNLSSIDSSANVHINNCDIVGSIIWDMVCNDIIVRSIFMEPILYGVIDIKCRNVNVFNSDVHLGDITCNQLVVKNCNILYGQTEIKGKNIVIDSTKGKFNNVFDGEHRFPVYKITGDTIFFYNSEWSGTKDYTGYAQLDFDGETIFLENSIFDNFTISIGGIQGGTPIFTMSKLSINFCVFKNIFYLCDTDSSFEKIEHSNFHEFRIMEPPYLDSIRNNIFNTIYTHAYSDTIFYNSPFSYNIQQFKNSGPNFPYFGLLVNIQTNSNGDSCDQWFNMKTDPLFADTTMTVLYNNSPAIKAASDGTNIGYYQGDGVGILTDNNQVNPANCELIIKNSSIFFNLLKSGNTRLQIYNIKGRLLETLVDSYKQAGNYKVNWDSKRFGSGIYLIKLSANVSSVSKKVTIIK